MKPQALRAALRAQTPRAACARLAGPRSTPRHPPTLLRAQKEDQPGPSERSYEDLFKEEIARRGLNGGAVTSSREDGEGTASTPRNPFASDPAPGARGSGPGIGGATSPGRGAAPPPGTSDRDGQRERSIAMVNEGLEGLIPRASQLLQLGGSVFLAFAPFILAISLLFAGIYSVFGESFVHTGEGRVSMPQYIDADALLAEPTVDPYVPFQ
ncbi:ribosomal RNA large subunit methyltransferase H [Raphidocelis subcapitata]|uniref:Ribosomal RNA large subunit methyltransferase H n=1 Tax=Raphidocelis subcapitata TaxID=307507 RepID=A0A2V0P3I6_9CHLO|nr:ribosomal RNA large subunit methyltransferase H [Raphidocelis subcapitata]|eukprot:GBF94149.1 ribosomal RNA large subunit methyltransferase H [Raphidocelis subcapitata]